MMDNVDKLRERVAGLEAIARERQEHALALTQRVFDEARRRRDAEAQAESARAGEAAALEEAAFFRADVGRIEEILQLTEEDAGDKIESAMAGESAALELLAANDKRVVALLEEQLYCRDHMFDAAADALQDALRIIDPIDCDEAPRDQEHNCSTCAKDNDGDGCLDECAPPDCPGWRNHVEIVVEIVEEEDTNEPTGK